MGQPRFSLSRVRRGVRGGSGALPGSGSGRAVGPPVFPLRARGVSRAGRRRPVAMVRAGGGEGALWGAVNGPEAAVRGGKGLTRLFSPGRACPSTPNPSSTGWRGNRWWWSWSGGWSTRVTSSPSTGTWTCRWGVRGGGKTPAGRVCWGGSEGSVEGAGSPGPALLLGGWGGAAG